MKRTLTELTERDRSILNHLRRYRLDTAKGLAKGFCDGSADAVKKIAQRLQDYIASEPLYGKTVYYRLTAGGARLVGAPEEAARPLGHQALPKAFGILAFCCHGPVKRERYTRAEFLEDLPELAEHVIRNEYYLDYYLEHDGTETKLGQIIVDLGGDYQRLISKCRNYVREALDTTHLKDIVVDDLLAFSLVVSDAQKAAVLREYLNEKPVKAQISVEVVPELANLLML